MIVDTISSAIRKVSSGKAVLASFAFFAVSAVLVNGRPFGLARLAEITAAQEFSTWSSPTRRCRRTRCLRRSGMPVGSST
ncbi:MAG: hypothetical protein PWR21_1191 [Methanoculleus sp.]|nr:hypothetical protein [Methanoculleus sp.]MDK2989487.1 hypothetical protein [Methanoculleus sp.]